MSEGDLQAAPFAISELHFDANHLVLHERADAMWNSSAGSQNLSVEVADMLNYKVQECAKLL